MIDPFNFDRFVTAQAGHYAVALAELKAGAKRSHWMWYVFPQLAGLGQSSMAHQYAIHSLAEARAYLAHPMLGPRLAECIAALQDLCATDMEKVLGTIDAIKLRSCLILFIAAGAGLSFRNLMRKYYSGEDQATLRLLQAISD